MKTSQIKIPEGYEIDTVDFKTGVITFKEKPRRWIDNPERAISRCQISGDSDIVGYSGENCPININVFAERKQAISALAKAQLSQIIANDSRFGGPVTNEEWNSSSTKYYLYRYGSRIGASLTTNGPWEFLAFHTAEQRSSFLQENEDLIKQYFELD